eukprot:4457439-Alexandrium_andersonii.AAC.1
MGRNAAADPAGSGQGDPRAACSAHVGRLGQQGAAGRVAASGRLAAGEVHRGPRSPVRRERLGHRGWSLAAG